MARVLICDDAAFMRMTIREALERGGHEVVAEATDAQEAIEIYDKLKPDLVTMDLLMKTSGQKGIRGILEKDPKAKIIIISVLDDQEGEVVEGVRMGALGIVTKPIKREVMLGEVERVLAIQL
jgi:two-component system, chemotaxis family, chemotaxis protein CheY